jgi:hypothetical protein
VWEEAKYDMIEYSSSLLPEDTANNRRRHMLYRQMVIRMNGDELLGKGNRVQL